MNNWNKLKTMQCIRCFDNLKEVSNGFECVCGWFITKAAFERVINNLYGKKKKVPNKADEEQQNFERLQAYKD